MNKILENMLMAAAKQNPNYNKVMDLIEQNGGNAEKAFFAKAQEMGVDPNKIINDISAQDLIKYFLK